MKINKKYHCSNFFLSEAEMQGLLHPAEANLRYFLAWFQSLQLPSTQSESPLAPKFLLLINPMCLFKVRTHLGTAYFIFRSGLTVTGLERVYRIIIIIIMQIPITKVHLSFCHNRTTEGYKHGPEIGGLWKKSVDITAIQNSMSQLIP
jgi:hypothetical protein